MARGIILFAHGSRDPLWSAPIEAVARRMRETAPAGVAVSCAYLEFTAPSLPQAAARLIAQGALSLPVWPATPAKTCRACWPRCATPILACPSRKRPPLPNTPPCSTPWPERLFPAPLTPAPEPFTP